MEQSFQDVGAPGSYQYNINRSLHGKNSKTSDLDELRHTVRNSINKDKGNAKRYFLPTMMNILGILTIIGSVITSFALERDVPPPVTIIIGLLSSFLFFGFAKCIKAACVYLESKS